MLYRLMLFFTCILLFKCGDKTELAVEAESSTKSTVNTISIQTIERLRYNDYILSPEAEVETSGWNEYIELAKQVEYLKKVDLSFFTQEESNLASFIVEFKENIPESLNTKPVKARILVLETRLLKLNNDLTLDNIPDNEKTESIKNFLVAMSNLNFVINKKLEFENNDVSRPDLGIVSDTTQQQ